MKAGSNYFAEGTVPSFNRSSTGQTDVDEAAHRTNVLATLLKLAQNQLPIPEVQARISDLQRKAEQKIYSLYTDNAATYMNTLLQNSIGVAYNQSHLSTAQTLTEATLKRVQHSIECGETVMHQRQTFSSASLEQANEKPLGLQDLAIKRQLLRQRLMQLNEELDGYNQHSQNSLLLQQAQNSQRAQRSVYSQAPGKDLFYGAKDYWSVNSDRTREAKSFVKVLNEDKAQRKAALTRKRMLSEQISKQREEEREQAEKRAKQEERLKELEEVQESIQKIQERKQKRKKNLEEYQQQVAHYLKQKPLYQQREEQYQQQFILPALEERKRRLSEIRNMRRPRELENEIQEHAKRYEEMRRQHETQRQTKLKSPQTERSFMHGYRGKSYEKSQKELINLHQLQQADIEAKRQKAEKLKEYSEIVREKHQPRIDESKTLELRAQIERVEAAKHPLKLIHKKRRLHIDDTYVDESKDEDALPSAEPQQQQNFSSEVELRKLGREYLQYSKQFAKQHQKSGSASQKAAAGNDQSALNETLATKNSSKYKNYLHELKLRETEHAEERPFFDWRRDIQDESLRGQEKFDRIIMKVQQMDDHARRKEILRKYNISSTNFDVAAQRQKRSHSHYEESVEDIYVNSIKAKLAILHEFIPDKQKIN